MFEAANAVGEFWEGGEAGDGPPFEDRVAGAFFEGYAFGSGGCGEYVEIFGGCGGEDESEQGDEEGGEEWELHGEFFKANWMTET